MAFFLLSGFVIAHSFERSSDQSFTTYFSKRWLRIYVPLAFVLLASYVLLCLREGAFAFPQTKQAIKNLLMLQDLREHLPGVVADPYLGNAPLWSLSYEWWFYMAFFAIATASKQCQHRVVSRSVYVATTIATIAYCIWPLQLIRYLAYFAIWWTGAHIALSLLREKRVTYKDVARDTLPLTISALLLVMNAWLRTPDLSLMRLGYSPVLEARHFVSALALLGAALVWSSLHWVGFNLVMRPFARLAPISFCIYISHWLFFKQMPPAIVPTNPIIAWILSLAYTLAFSCLVELLVYPRIRSAALTGIDMMRGRAREPA